MYIHHKTYLQPKECIPSQWLPY